MDLKSKLLMLKGLKYNNIKSQILLILEDFKNNKNKLNKSQN
jgi:hypothetical protein